MPSFVQNNEAIYGAGIDNIICVGATDPFTLRSWEISWDSELELVPFFFSFSFFFLFLKNIYNISLSYFVLQRL